MGRWYEGGPPGDEPLGGARGQTGVFNPIARIPQWMRAALGLTTDELPNRLRIDQVIPAIEFGQQGWGFASYFPVQVDLTFADPFQFPERLERDDSVIRRLLYIEAFAGVAVAASLILRTDIEALGVPGGLVTNNITETALAPATAIATTAELVQGTAIALPPRMRFGLQVNGLLVGENVIVQMIWAEFPAGYPLPI